MTKNELQTIRLWNPLFPKTYERDRDGHVANYPTDLSTAEIVPYLEKILAAIDKHRIQEEGERDLAIYLDDEILQEKVYSIQPSVEEWDGRLWGITEVQLYQKLEEKELEDGELYLSFWASGSGFFIKLEDEMLREFSENAEIGMK